MADNLRIAFIKSAIWHGSLDEAAGYLTSHPELADSDIRKVSILIKSL